MVRRDCVVEHVCYSFWLALLVWLRAKQKRRADWSWAIPVVLALCSLNWLGPDFFSLAIVYVHPLVALWFLDRHLSGHVLSG